eukprot:gene23230-biopygen17799
MLCNADAGAPQLPSSPCTRRCPGYKCLMGLFRTRRPELKLRCTIGPSAPQERASPPEMLSLRRTPSGVVVSRPLLVPNDKNGKPKSTCRGPQGARQRAAYLAGQGPRAEQWSE